MFHSTDRDAFEFDPTAYSSIEKEALAHWDMGLMRKTAEYERSKEMKSLLARVGHFLGDLAESRRNSQ